MKQPDEIRVLVRNETEIVAARQKGREMAAQLGFSATDLTLIATAISEVARNILLYGKHGEIVLSLAQRGPKRGLGVVATDVGPGIVNIGQAMQDGFSTSGGLGLGLPGVKRLMDEFEVVSKVGHGTTVRFKKWLP